MAVVDPFPSSEFDQWADSYDQDVAAQPLFPFAGYDRVLDTVVQLAAADPGTEVLELGIGTGNLARRFADLGCRIWGSDFSPAMLAKAQDKLPEATLVRHDLRDPLPEQLQRRFDRIVSAYTFHHFEMRKKVSLIDRLMRDHVNSGGRMVIGDISFRSAGEMAAFAASVGEAWELEPYWLTDEAQAALQHAGLMVSYEQVSECAGVYEIERAGQFRGKNEEAGGRRCVPGPGACPGAGGGRPEHRPL